MPAFSSGFLVKEPAWHGLGTVIQEAPSVADGIKLAGLDWRVGFKEIFDGDGNSLSGFARATYRESDGRILGVVGTRTHLLQNSEAFEFFQPWIEADQAELHTAGALHDGRIVWILAKLKLDDSVIVKNDVVNKFILLSNSHDGSKSVRLGFNPIRVVCANTLAMAHGAKQGKLVRIRHSSKVKENVEAVRDTMNLLNQEFEATADQYRLLARKQINRSDLRRYFKIVLAGKEIEEKDVSTRLANLITRAMQLHDSGRGSQITGVQGSLWGGYNAITEYLNFERGHTQNSRLNGLWFGDSAKMNQFALDVALSMAG